MSKNTIWTEDQDKYLRENYPAKLVPELCKHLLRTGSAVESRLQRLGLVRKNKWTKEQKDFLRCNYPNMPFAELVQKIGKDRSCIQRKASAMGIKRTRKAIGRARKANNRKRRKAQRQNLVINAPSRKKKVIAPNRWDRKKMESKAFTMEGKKTVRIDSKTVILVPATATEDRIAELKITYELSKKRNQFSL